MPAAGGFVRTTDVIPSSSFSTWTPTYAGISAIGNAVVNARYFQTGKLVNAWYQVTFGTTTTFSAAFLTVSLPVTAHASYIQGSAVGSGYAMDGGAASTRRGFTTVIASSGAVFFVVDSLAANASVSNTVPWTWASTDILTFHAMYEAA